MASLTTPRDFAAELRAAESAKDWSACLRISQDATKYEADKVLAANKAWLALKPASKIPTAEASLDRQVTETGQHLTANAALAERHVLTFRQKSAAARLRADEAGLAKAYQQAIDIRGEATALDLVVDVLVEHGEKKQRRARGTTPKRACPANQSKKITLFPRY